jgi:hypothetical protein
MSPRQGSWCDRTSSQCRGMRLQATNRDSISSHVYFSLRWLWSLLPSKLFLYLPHTVNDQQGRAQWDGKKEVLSISLPIVRREDED